MTEIKGPLGASKKDLIELFVEFYGEEHRENITENINNTFFIFTSRLYLFDGQNGKNKIEDDIVMNLQKHIDFQSKKFAVDILMEAFKIENNSENLEKLWNIAPDYLKLLTKNKNFYDEYDENLLKDFQSKMLEIAANKKKGAIPRSYKKAMDYVFNGGTRHYLLDQFNAVVSKFSKSFESQKYLMGLYEKIDKEDIFLAEEIKNYISDFVMGDKGEYGGSMFITTSKSLPSQVKSVCVIDKCGELSDLSFIHEVNHIASAASWLKIDDAERKRYYVKTGYCKQYFCVEEYLTNEREDSWQQYDGINEVVNDYLATKIFKLAEDKGVKFGRGESRPSFYSFAFPIFENFFEDNLELLKEAYISKDNLAFAKAIGIENFENLANLSVEIFKFESGHRTINREIRKYYSCLNSDLFKIAKDKSVKPKNKAMRKYLSFFEKGEKIFNDIYEELKGKNDYEVADNKRI